jgi:hypothetical protein
VAAHAAERHRDGRGNEPRPSAYGPEPWPWPGGRVSDRISPCASLHPPSRQKTAPVDNSGLIPSQRTGGPPIRTNHGEASLRRRRRARAQNPSAGGRCLSNRGVYRLIHRPVHRSLWGIERIIGPRRERHSCAGARAFGQTAPGGRSRCCHRVPLLSQDLPPYGSPPCLGVTSCASCG